MKPTMTYPLSKQDERYRNDSQYRMFVDHLETLIHQLHFSPSEIREMAMYACLRFEMRRPLILQKGGVPPYGAGIRLEDLSDEARAFVTQEDET
jgi:hypothetical protein